ncbi:TadE family type IV pilus minor pilin [Rhodococcus sp. ARC_M6]|uniref:TadE family type IV pilus minor pilin n=1 Tax=Rhodococcus sp. ARC_M6 TaxID=2928852 RepID=UPI001FB2258E|nr:TadE family type IV pilus minor pilin [Rhodococcus sp. ARC_M6]MCJ0906438.1 pilus assembly protein TadE [Rhodococcus sp. ARC_M6]
MLSTRSIRRSDDGAVTVEAAIGLASIITVVVLCIGAVLAVSMQVRCVDAAREAARLTARGDRDNAITTARRIGPSDARISVQIVDGFVVAVVSADSALLPMVNISAEAVASVEPGVSG